MAKVRVKRDRDSEACSDRGCARYRKERGSGRIERRKERGSGRIDTKSAANRLTAFPIAKVTHTSLGKCHRGSGRCNVKLIESVDANNTMVG